MMYVHLGPCQTTTRVLKAIMINQESVDFGSMWVRIRVGHINFEMLWNLSGACTIMPFLQKCHINSGMMCRMTWHDSYINEDPTLWH